MRGSYRLKISAFNVSSLLPHIGKWGLRDYGVDGQIGLESTPEAYIAMMVEVFRRVWRVLHDDGTLWLNMGDCYATGAGKVGEHPGGGERGARWTGDIERIRDEKRGYRGDRLPNGHGNLTYRKGSNRAQRGDGNANIPYGPMTQPNRMPIAGLKPKDLVGMPWRLALSLQADGWYLRRDIIWSKPNPMPESVSDRPTTAHEYIFMLTKSERYHFDQAAVAEPQEESERRRRMAEQARGLNTRYNLRRDIQHGQVAPGQNGVAHSVAARHRLAEKGTRNIRSVWTIATQPYPEAHFATFPEDLIKPCILAGCPVGGIVLDPFVGSGTTVKVAQDLGRVGVGLELNGKYLAMAQRRTAQLGFGNEFKRSDSDLELLNP